MITPEENFTARLEFRCILTDNLYLCDSKQRVWYRYSRTEYWVITGEVDILRAAVIAGVLILEGGTIGT